MTYTATVQGRLCAFGIDVSNNNGKRPIDAAQVAATGFAFVVAKATEGATYRDAYYEGNRDRTRATGMLFGAYHWLKPNKPLSSQVALFLNHTANGTGCDFIACDAEEAGLTDDLVVGWCDQVAAATGVPVWIYCGSFTDPKVRSTGWLKYTPWLAAYPRDADNDDDPTDLNDPRVPGPWNRWDVWQFDSDGEVAGVAGNCDLNVIDVRVLAQLGTGVLDETLDKEDDDMASLLVQDPDNDHGTWELLGLQRRHVTSQTEIDILRYLGAGYLGGDTDAETRRLWLRMRTPVASSVDPAAIAAAVIASLPQGQGANVDEAALADAVAAELAQRLES